MAPCSPEWKVYSNSIAFTGSLEAAQDSTIHTQPCSNRRCGIFVQNGLFSHPAVFYPRAINLAYKGLTLQTFTQNRSRTPNWTSKVRYWRQKQRKQARARTKYILDEGKHRDFFLLKVVTTTTKKIPFRLKRWGRICHARGLSNRQFLSWQWSPLNMYLLSNYPELCN